MKVSSTTEKKQTITLELSDQEAEILCALVGGIGWNLDGEAGSFLYDTFFSLNKELPDREVSFSDYFEGDAWCK